MAEGPDIQTSFNNPDPGDCPQNIVELIALLNMLVHSEMLEDFITYVTGADIPAVEDQDKVWHRLDSSGRPIGTYVFYSGTWRRQYTHPIGAIVMYSGDPATDFTGVGHKGTIGGQWDGFQLCSGENGSPNLTDRFIVGAKMDDLATGYVGGNWQTNINGTGESVGGSKEWILDENTAFVPPRDAVRVSYWTADNNHADPGSGLYGIGATVDLLPGDPGLTDPDPIPTVPPFYALAFAVFVGYE